MAYDEIRAAVSCQTHVKLSSVVLLGLVKPWMRSTTRCAMAVADDRACLSDCMCITITANDDHS